MKTSYEIIIADKRYFFKTNNKILINEIKKEFYVTRLEKNKRTILNIDKSLNTFTQKNNLNRKNASKILGFVMSGILENLTIKNNTLIMHGSSMHIKKRGYVFMGRSGAGKSTIIDKISRRNILSDDTAILKMINNKWFIFNTPFDKNKVPNSFKKIPLHGIFIIKKSPKEAITEIVSPFQIKEIFKNDLFMMNNGNFLINKTNKISRKKISEFLLTLIKTIPVKLLYFRKNTKINKLINTT